MVHWIGRLGGLFWSRYDSPFFSHACLLFFYSQWAVSELRCSTWCRSRVQQHGCAFMAGTGAVLWSCCWCVELLWSCLLLVLGWSSNKLPSLLNPFHLDASRFLFFWNQLSGFFVSLDGYIGFPSVSLSGIEMGAKVWTNCLLPPVPSTKFLQCQVWRSKAVSSAALFCSQNFYDF